VASSTPSHLRLYNETRPESAGGLGDFWPGLDKLCRAFEQVTGWPLQCQPEPVASEPRGDIVWSAPAATNEAEGQQLFVAVTTAEGATESPSPVELDAAVDLAATIGQLLADLAHARQALWKREAELAAGVPLAPRASEPHLALRLQSSLRAAAQAAGCKAAALYLVDETTTYLKLRSVWGLPQERLTLPPRELGCAAADLEALLGHAIVLEDTATQAVFQPPEPAASAVCVPVASATAPLGTLWVLSDEPRAFNDPQVNMVEIVAGRIAAELEREMLVGASADASRWKRQFAAAERWQDEQSPRRSPLNDIWQVAGWTQSAGELSGEFYDWFVRPDESLAIALGGSAQEGIEAALSASSLRAAIRAHGQGDQSADPSAVLGCLNEAFFSGSAGDHTASLALIFADAQKPALSLASAGDLAIWKITGNGSHRLARRAPPIGYDAATQYAPIELTFESGELLVVLSAGASRTLQQAGPMDLAEELRSSLEKNREQPSDVLVELIHDRLTAAASAGPLNDCTALVLKCR
jgi:phosphoserine phosphatase RsbU/P